MKDNWRRIVRPKGFSIADGPEDEVVLVFDGGGMNTNIELTDRQFVEMFREIEKHYRGEDAEECHW